jgi:putative endonuclease
MVVIHTIPYLTDKRSSKKDNIEVRTKKSLEFGTPEESITSAKMGKLRNVAARYLQTHDNLPSLWRIDVVAIELDPKGKPSRIELIESAVSQD